MELPICTILVIKHNNLFSCIDHCMLYILYSCYPAWVAVQVMQLTGACTSMRTSPLSSSIYITYSQLNGMYAIVVMRSSNTKKDINIASKCYCFKIHQTRLEGSGKCCINNLLWPNLSTKSPPPFIPCRRQKEVMQW